MNLVMGLKSLPVKQLVLAFQNAALILQRGGKLLVFRKAEEKRPVIIKVPPLGPYFPLPKETVKV